MRSGDRLTPKQKAKIVDLYSNHDLSVSALAERFGVCQVTINNAIRQSRGHPQLDSSVRLEADLSPAEAGGAPTHTKAHA